MFIVSRSTGKLTSLVVGGLVTGSEGTLGTTVEELIGFPNVSRDFRGGMTAGNLQTRGYGAVDEFVGSFNAIAIPTEVTACVLFRGLAVVQDALCSHGHIRRKPIVATVEEGEEGGFWIAPRFVEGGASEWAKQSRVGNKALGFALGLGQMNSGGIFAVRGAAPPGKRILIEQGKKKGNDQQEPHVHPPSVSRNSIFGLA